MTVGLASLAAIAIALIAIVLGRPRITVHPGGKILAFVALFLLPLFLTGAGTATHLRQAKRTEFCLSCHVMEPYGRSLLLDDSEALPATHFQNRRVDRDEACYACHTSYTMFGDLRSKWKGLRHVWVYYVGTMPEEISLYEPYANRECLHCHAGARSFEESELHADMRQELTTGEERCLDCHDIVHEVDDLDGAALWGGGES